MVVHKVKVEPWRHQPRVLRFRPSKGFCRMEAKKEGLKGGSGSTDRFL